MTKPELRKHHQKLRGSMTMDEVLKKSDAIIASLIRLEPFQKADVIFSYDAIGNEVFLDYNKLKDYQIALPQVISPQEMAFRQISAESDYELGTYGVREPVNGIIVSPTKNSVILVPGSAFDMSGHRIGYGGGYYDRYMKAHPDTLKIGVCFDHQMTKKIPSEAHDITVDLIITEKQTYQV